MLRPFRQHRYRNSNCLTALTSPALLRTVFCLLLKMTIGVLALQGDYDAHRKLLEGAPDVARVLEVRDVASLNLCDGLVIPGGESTTMSRLCDRYELWQPLHEKLQSGMGVFGTCAGLIMLSHRIDSASKNFAQKTLDVLDVDVARNAYGAQLDSFECDLEVRVSGFG